MYVPLVKKGHNYLGLCPFHKEKTPSFSVSREKGFYKCFGCGRSGDSIKFLQEHLHLDFVEAVTQLATQLHIVIPAEDIADPTGEHARRDAARAAIKAAEEFYRTVLDSSDGAPARSFYHSRGFNKDVIEKFRLGASPAAWDVACIALQKQGFTVEQIIDAGLGVQRPDGSVFDRFRGRAMFPLHDHQGRPVGFSARQLVNDANSAKYINSPQTIVFEKSRVLYALDIARRPIADNAFAILVEGQPDVVAMHQAGFTNTIATSGTALTEEHLVLLKRYTTSIVLAYDADDAGRKATTRAIELALAGGFSVRCIMLPPAHDPDSYLKQNGSAAMQELIDNPVSWMQFQSMLFRELGFTETAAGQSTAIHTMLGWIKSVPDVIQHPFLVRDLAKEFNIAEGLLQDQLPAISRTTQQRAAGQSRVSQPIPKPPAIPKPPTIHPAERELLRVALTLNNGLTDMLHVHKVTAELFVTETARAVYTTILVGCEEHPDVSHYLLNEAGLSSECLVLVNDILSSVANPSEQWRRFDVEIPEPETHRLIQNSLDQLQRFRLDAEIGGLNEELRRVSDSDMQRRLQYQMQELLTKRIALINRIERSPSNATWLDEDSV